MRGRRVAHGVTTGLVAVDAIYAGIAYLMRVRPVVLSFEHMGYPPYFMQILGVAQLLGAIGLLVPRRPTINEWAYAGFTFTYIGGCISHLASGDGAKEALQSLLLLAILAASYFTRPARASG
jgi:hypothetical protein